MYVWIFAPNNVGMPPMPSGSAHRRSDRANGHRRFHYTAKQAVRDPRPTKFNSLQQLQALHCCATLQQKARQVVQPCARRRRDNASHTCRAARAIEYSTSGAALGDAQGSASRRAAGGTVYPVDFVKTQRQTESGKRFAGPLPATLVHYIQRDGPLSVFRAWACRSRRRAREGY